MAVIWVSYILYLAGKERKGSTVIIQARGTHIQILQTVPAEGVFAALTQHLCTALVPLDVDTTHRTLLDGHVRVAVRAGPVDGGEDTGDIRYVVNGGTLEYEATKRPQESLGRV